MKQTRMGKTVLMLFLILAISPVCRAQATLAGNWQGTLTIGDQVYHPVVHITVAADGGLKATADNPEQNAFDIPVEDVVLKDSKFTFSVVAANGSYEGTVNKDATEIIGAWTQQDSYVLNLKRLPATSAPTSAPAPTPAPALIPAPTPTPVPTPTPAPAPVKPSQPLA
jgi:hypothetical protein